MQLFGTDGLSSLRLTEVPAPQPGPSEVLIQVKAAGVNFAETERMVGRYPAPRPLPIIMGFEAAGVVAAVGSNVDRAFVGSRVTAIVSTGGYAEYALADARNLIPVPEGTSFAAASTIPVQGISALALLRYAARPQATDMVLVQAAAGGVGLYLVQLLRILGVRHIVALASGRANLDLVRSVGADVAIDYAAAGWSDDVQRVTEGQGVELVLECVSGSVGDESFRPAGSASSPRTCSRSPRCPPPIRRFSAAPPWARSCSSPEPTTPRPPGYDDEMSSRLRASSRSRVT